MFPTKSELPKATRSKSIEILNRLLASCIDLQTQCKQAHWNVKGPQFISLHKLFDDVNEAVEDYVDEVAERVMQLGGTTMGTARQVAECTELPEYPKNAVTGEQHTQALATALAAFAGHSKKAIGKTADLEDEVSADIITEITRGVDKWLWFVEAHLQAKR